MDLTISLPPPVRPGDRVGVAALSGPVAPEQLAAGIEGLGRLGYEPVVAENLGSRWWLFAGDDRERLAAFHRLAADPTLRAIFFARGGHGVLRLLPRLDWDLLARHPRAYVGYSDLTPLLLELVRRLGLVSFHGPMVADLARGLGPEEARSLAAALAGEYPAAVPLASWPRPGEAEGPLLGGCLSLLVATLGTPFAPDLRGSLLFWEDVNEPPYRLDRMLTHLALSGNLTEIKGMMVGCIDFAQELMEFALSSYPWPLAGGLASGHCRPNLTLPLGLPARMDPAAGCLVLGAATGVR